MFPLKDTKLASPAMEDYLETILELSEVETSVRVTDIAIKLNVAKASVSQAVNNLAQLGFVEQERYGPILLTEKGHKQARKIQRRHQVLRRFLIDVLNVEPEVAEKDACLIEHVISSMTMDRLCEFLEAQGLLL